MEESELPRHRLYAAGKQGLAQVEYRLKYFLLQGMHEFLEAVYPFCETLLCLSTTEEASDIPKSDDIVIWSQTSWMYLES